MNLGSMASVSVPRFPGNHRGPIADRRHGKNARLEELEVMHPAAKLIVMAAKSQDPTEKGLGYPGSGDPQIIRRVKQVTIPKF